MERCTYYNRRVVMYKPDKGLSFYQAVRTLKEILAEEKVKDRKMLFNDIEIWVNIDSFVDDIAYIYDLKCEIRRLVK